MTSLQTPIPAPVSVIVLTFNEERNLPACLESVAGWAEEIFVVDSGSTDGTPGIAERFGARLVTHAFDTHARQWEWALSTLPIRTAWVLALDADQQATARLRDEAARELKGTDGAGITTRGFFVRRKQVFRGRWIRHGGYYPKYLLKLFRLGYASVDPGELVDHHFMVDGVVRKLDADIIEDNRNEASIAEWTAKHNRYATLQARQEIGGVGAPATTRSGAAFGSPDDRTRWLKSIWRRLPIFIRPCVYVFYRYVIRLGFLDGKEGFIFHVLQGFWYRLLVDINIDEMRRAPISQAGDPAGLPARPMRSVKE